MNCLVNTDLFFNKFQIFSISFLKYWSALNSTCITPSNYCIVRYPSTIKSLTDYLPMSEKFLKKSDCEQFKVPQV